MGVEGGSWLDLDSQVVRSCDERTNCWLFNARRWMLNLAIVKLVYCWIVKSWNSKFCSRLKISKVKRSEVRFVYPPCWNKLIRLGLNFRENFILLEFFEKNRKKIKDSRVEFYKCFYIMLWKNKMVCTII